MSDALSRPWHLKVSHSSAPSIGLRAYLAAAARAWSVHDRTPRRSRTTHRRTIVMALAGTIVVFVGIGLLLLRAPGDGAIAPVASLVEVPAAWLDIAKPVQIFSLEAPEFGHEGPIYTAKRWSGGGRRVDTLAYGAFDASMPTLRLTIERTKAEGSATDRAPLYVAIARQAAETNLSVARSGLSDVLATRFGAFEIADVQLSDGDDALARSMPCSGFRLILDRPALSVSGLACNGATAFARRTLACIIDRLDLASGGDDQPLVDFFALSELQRDQACVGARLGPDQTHPTWHTDKPRHTDKPATPRKRLRRH